MKTLPLVLLGIALFSISTALEAAPSPNTTPQATPQPKATSVAQNLLLNGGFETGSLNLGWNTSGSATVTSDTSLVISGSYSAEILYDYDNGVSGTLSQTFSPTAGQLYKIQFTFASPIDGGWFDVYLLMQVEIA